MFYEIRNGPSVISNLNYVRNIEFGADKSKDAGLAASSGTNSTLRSISSTESENSLKY